MDEKLELLRQRIVELHGKMEVITATADDEGRDLSDDELKQLKAFEVEIDRTREEIARRERIAAEKEQLAKPAGRKTDPVPTSEYKLPAEVKDGKLGFKSMGDFALSVHRACIDGGSVDRRLAQLAPTVYGSESNGSDGGFAVPPDFRAEITTKVMGEESLLRFCDQWQTNSNNLTVPVDELEPWNTSGIRAYWEGEAASIRQSKPQIKDSTTKLNKLAALVPLSDELLEDAPAMDGYLRRKVPEAMVYKINEAILFGTGVGMPLGIIGHGGTIVVTEEASQAADTVTAGNVIDMWGQMYGPSRQRAVWVANQDAEAQLDRSYLAVANGSNGIAAWPMYLPPGGLSGARYATLRGREVVTLENCSALGDSGDIILADFSKYMVVTKTAGMRQDISIHLYFDQDLSCYRFIWRMGGKPWWAKPVTRAKSVKPLGAFVVLEDRTGS